MATINHLKKQLPAGGGATEMRRQVISEDNDVSCAVWDNFVNRRFQKFQPTPRQNPREEKKKFFKLSKVIYGKLS